ncbi:uncharacterized protein LOC124693229 isoform X2 [Lolium rigidum]|uniref:uncharacterized protein LOC124693229 isoform X2 n=1 Tax=Lolium rigidum TaxID=89674 RepID=UPI001F5C0B6A|nr:uncharacterized protein LOC124693229 isoform X2 [Lolium rigidum]XP_047082654.1 uncharacterized protein LOC124693229 isoform X2 [Lolium rigidum]XP_047082655.1 uncharacterized protein LOC124693229 isoform X2 [Lolium rigidum]
MSDRGEVAQEALNRYFIERNAARLLSLENMKEQSKRCVRIFPFNTEPTPSDFERLYDRRLEWYKSIAVLNVPGSKYDGSEVEIPVTIDYPEEDDGREAEDHSYHIVSITRAHGWNKGRHRLERERAEIVVRQSDNYIVAFRVFKTEAERARTPWCVFADVELPAFFGKQIKLNYTTTHGKLAKVRFGAHVLEDIFRFLADMQSNPHQKNTSEGKNYFVTLFVLLGEAQRFQLLQLFFMEHASSVEPLKPSPHLWALFNDWSTLCKLVFEHYIAYLDKPLADAYRAEHKGDEGYTEEKNPFAQMMAKAVNKLGQMLRKHATALHFEPDKRGLYLVGRELLLLNCDITMVLDILMRHRGYDGEFYIKKRSDEASAQMLFEQEIARKEREAEEQRKAEERDAEEREAEEREAEEREAEEADQEKGIEAEEETVDEELEFKKHQKKMQKKKDKQLRRFSGGSKDVIPEDEGDCYQGKLEKAIIVEAEERSEEGFRKQNKKLKSRKATKGTEEAEDSKSCEEEHKALSVQAVKKSKGAHQKTIKAEQSKACEEVAMSIEVAERKKQQEHQQQQQQLKSNSWEEAQRHQNRKSNKQKKQLQRLFEDVAVSSDKAEHNSSSSEENGKKNKKKKKKKKKGTEKQI